MKQKAVVFYRHVSTYRQNVEIVILMAYEAIGMTCDDTEMWIMDL